MRVYQRQCGYEGIRGSMAMLGGHIRGSVAMLGEHIRGSVAMLGGYIRGSVAPLMDISLIMDKHQY